VCGSCFYFGFHRASPKGLALVCPARPPHAVRQLLRSYTVTAHGGGSSPVAAPVTPPPPFPASQLSARGWPRQVVTKDRGRCNHAGRLALLWVYRVPLTPISCPSLCAIILFMDHPCDLYLYGFSRQSPAPLANPLCPCPSIPPKLSITGQGLFRLVRHRRPLGGAGTSPCMANPLLFGSTPLAYVHFPPLPYFTHCCLMCHSIFSIQPIPLCIQTFIIRIDDLTNAGEIRAARRQEIPLRGPTISKFRASLGISPP
jgi:hypothetical protein